MQLRWCKTKQYTVDTLLTLYNNSYDNYFCIIPHFCLKSILPPYITKVDQKVPIKPSQGFLRTCSVMKCIIIKGFRKGFFTRPKLRQNIWLGAFEEQVYDIHIICIHTHRNYSHILVLDLDLTLGKSFGQPW